MVIKTHEAMAIADGGSSLEHRAKMGTHTGGIPAGMPVPAIPGPVAARITAAGDGCYFHNNT
jgi:hypothetical protein